MLRSLVARIMLMTAALCAEDHTSTSQTRSTDAELLSDVPLAKPVCDTRQSKIRRLVTRGKAEKEAQEPIDTVDGERADFIKKYFSVECPDRAIYDAMINTSCGDEATMRMILNFMEAYAPCAIA